MTALNHFQFMGCFKDLSLDEGCLQLWTGDEAATSGYGLERSAEMFSSTGGLIMPCSTDESS